MTVQSPPGAPRPLPRPPVRQQLGLLRRMMLAQEPQPVLDELNSSLGPVCGIGAGPMRLAVVGDPAALKDLFATSTDSFRWGHKFNVLAFVVGPGSMIVSDGDDHKRRRSSVQAAFSRRRLNGWIPMIVDRTDAAVDRLATTIPPGAGSVVDMYQFGRSLVLEIVVRAMFGEDMAQRAAEIGSLFQRPQDYLESSAMRQMPHPFPFTERARVRADRRALDAIIDSQIAERRARPTGDPLDVIDALVHDGTLTDGEMRDQVVTLIGAGYDTTAASLAWLLSCCARFPEWWSQMRAEADAVFGPLESPPAASEDTLAALDVTRRVMCETLRLHPAGAISPRETTTDVVVAGFVIPKKTLVLWSAHLAGRDPKAWPDPNRFDPDRFKDPSPEQKALADTAWVPFGRGARNCIGFALAQMELTLIAARLAQRLDMAATSDTIPHPVGLVVNRPRGGLHLRVSARPGP